MTYPPPPGSPDPYNSPPDPTPQDPFANQPSNPYAQQPVSPPPPSPPQPASAPPSYGQTSAPPYGQQPSGPPYGAPYGAQQPYGYAPAAPPQNSMALTAMILSLVGIVTWITAPVGAILGHIALKQIRQTGESGEGMAKTGIIVGWILTGIGVLCCLAYVGIFAAAFSQGLNNAY